MPAGMFPVAVIGLIIAPIMVRSPGRSPAPAPSPRPPPPPSATAGADFRLQPVRDDDKPPAPGFNCDRITVYSRRGPPAHPLAYLTILTRLGGIRRKASLRWW